MKKYILLVAVVFIGCNNKKGEYQKKFYVDTSKYITIYSKSLTHLKVY